MMDNDERRHEYRRKPGDQPVTNDDLDEALAVHAREERAYVKELFNKVEYAFPDGFETHRLFHVQQAKAARAEEEFWRTAKEQFTRAGVNGVVTLIKVLFILIALGLTAKFTMPDAFAKLIIGALSK